MSEPDVLVKRDVALYTDHFVASHNDRGQWTVRQADHHWSDGGTPSWVLWFDGHARDSHRHIFWSHEDEALKCADEAEAHALLMQLEKEYGQWRLSSAKLA